MKKIEFSPPDITEEEIAEVVDTLRSGWITTGPKTKKFERQIADYCNTDKAVALNSATACMEMTLRLLGVGPGDEVITSAYTYTASASVIHHVGAKIVLVDTQKDSLEMDYEALAYAITEKTKAIIPVDIAGIMCDYDTIYKVLESKRNLFKPANEIQKKFGRVIVLADAAHSFGATYKNKKSGEVADFTSFSFHAVKNITTGEGGAVTWRTVRGLDNQEIYQSYMNLSLHGQTKDALAKTKLGAWEYDIVAPNYKCNMTDIMASIGLVQLKRYPQLLKKRKALIDKYNKLLLDTDISTLDHNNELQTSSGHLYMIRIPSINEKKRDAIITSLAQKKISTNVHYKPLPMLSAYKKLGFTMENYPNAYSMYVNEITLPLHTLLTESDIVYIINELKKELFT